MRHEVAYRIYDDRRRRRRATQRQLLVESSRVAWRRDFQRTLAMGIPRSDTPSVISDNFKSATGSSSSSFSFSSSLLVTDDGLVVSVLVMIKNRVIKEWTSTDSIVLLCPYQDIGLFWL